MNRSIHSRKEEKLDKIIEAVAASVLHSVLDSSEKQDENIIAD
jgi:hypothetical protein